MNKPIRYILECLIYIVLLAVCLPYAIISFELSDFRLMFANAGASLIMAVMVVWNIVEFVKALINQRKGRRYK